MSAIWRETRDYFVGYQPHCFPLDDSSELDLWMKCIKNHLQSNFGDKLSAAVLYAEANKFQISNDILRTCSRHSATSRKHFDLKLDDFLKSECQSFSSIQHFSLDDSNGKIEMVINQIKMVKCFSGGEGF